MSPDGSPGQTTEESETSFPGSPASKLVASHPGPLVGLFCRWRARGRRVADYFGIENPSEFSAAAALLVLLIVFKVINIMRYRFGTDEPQHLHVIWGWARGFVQYRDICDNHMPLFQIIFAPVFALIGDRATILYWMRLILLPMYFVSAWCTYKIGELLFSRRTGLWALIMAGLYPGYNFYSLEFRTDNLWAPLWLLCILTVVKRGITVSAATTAGLLAGLCFGISMKTSLLFVSLLVSASLSVAFVGRARLGLTWKEIARCTAAFVLTALLIPTIIFFAFWIEGVWPQLRYWVFENNVVPGLINHPVWWIVAFPLLFPLCVLGAYWICRQAPDELTAFRRCLVFLFCGFYVPALWSYWPLVTGQDYIPYHPLGFVLYTGALLAISSGLQRQPFILGPLLRRAPLPAFIAGGEFLFGLFVHPFWVDGAKEETQLLRTILSLTKPSDYVLDEKGETIFRQRSFQPIWEPFVMERIRRGLIIDDAAERSIATRACVATLRQDMSVAATRFILENYVPIGKRLRVAGVFLRPSSADPSRADFKIEVPAFYKIVAADAEVSGLLDDTPYNGKARFLSPGPHTFRHVPTANPLVVLWAQAADRNFTPFNRRPASGD